MATKKPSKKPAAKSAAPAEVKPVKDSLTKAALASHIAEQTEVEVKNVKKVLAALEAVVLISRVMPYTPSILTGSSVLTRSALRVGKGLILLVILHFSLSIVAYAGKKASACRGFLIQPIQQQL